MHKVTKTAAVLAIAVVAAVCASTARAGTALVGAYGCFANGGQTTVPAGSTVGITQGIAETRRGVLQAYLNAQSTTVSVNGGAAVDLSAHWTAPSQQSDGSWLTRVRYDTGVTLAAGQSLTFRFEIVLNNPVPEVTGGQPAFNPSGSQGVWACTVTAV
jgi:hypothetical protein